MKSLTMLLGIPSLGLVLGTVTGMFLHQTFGFQTLVIYFIASAGLFLGIVSSIVTYRSLSAEIQPFISHIISSSLQAPVASKTIDPVCKKEIESLI